MYDEKIVKIYQLYDIFNDFNRLSILMQLYNDELTIEEINKRTNIKNIVIFHQLEYLCNKKVVVKTDDKYKIADKTLNKLIGKMINYVSK